MLFISLRSDRLHHTDLYCSASARWAGWIRLWDLVTVTGAQVQGYTGSPQ